MIVGLAMVAGGILAGLFGSLLGLGGGILIVPFLSLVMGMTIQQAVGVSLVCVIVTSGASAAVYLERRVANLRLGMVLELFTASGAVIGGAIAFLLNGQVLAGLFTAMLVYTAVSMIRRREADPDAVSADPEPDDGAPANAAPAAAANAAPANAAPAATANPAVNRGAGLSGTGVWTERPMPDRLDAFAATLSGPGYRVTHLRVGTIGAVFAGVMSALLGIGGGLVKVPLMHLFMNVPLRVATATSNLMVGITASTSAIVYLLRGGIDPFVAGPTALGVFVGAAIGSRTAHRIDLKLLRILFVVVLLYTAYEMARRALGIS